jgi:P pilus assembly chaperone PapD
VRVIFFSAVPRWASIFLVAWWVPAAVGAPVEPPAQVAVSPSRVELQIGASPTTESLTLFNFGDEPVQIAVSVAHWDLDEQNAVRIIEPHEQSLDQWIVVNPLRFTVAAKSSQTVRYSIRPRVQPEPGEHRAMIYFDQVLPRDPSEKLRVKFRMGVAIYAHAGEISREGKLNAIQVLGGTNPVSARFDISSKGTAHVRLLGQYAVWPAGRYPGHEGTSLFLELGNPGASLPEGPLIAGNLPAKPVLPDTRRNVLLHTPTKLPPGSYVLDLNGEIGSDSIDLGIPFTVPHPSQVSIPPPDGR